MSGNQSHSNITAELLHKRFLDRVLFSSVTTVSCCVFLFINVTMLFTLRSKPVFRETCRYVLLYNLLFADTVLLAQGQLLYIISAFGKPMTYPVCGFFTSIANLTNVISPLTLVLMSLERFVAICYPLRHAAIVTVRNTGVTIVMVWSVSLLNVFTQVLLLLNFPFENLQTLQMKTSCNTKSILLSPSAALYDKAFRYFVFVSAAVAIISSYIGVIAAARSASTDKASARKARNTLLLHLLQLGLSLSSIIYNPLLAALYKILDKVTFYRINNVLYIFIIIAPRCLSSLIYGPRDQNIRPVLLYHLFCQSGRVLFVSVAPAKAKIKILITS